MSKSNSVIAVERTQVDWSKMSLEQLSYQANCFELHENRIPASLQRELDRRAEDFNARSEMKAERNAEMSLEA